MRLRVLVALVLIASLSSLLLGRCEAASYRNYTYDMWGTPVPGPQAYVPERILGADELGTAFSNLQDVHVTSSHIYLLDAGLGTLFIYDTEWRFVSSISGFENDGSPDRFRNPRGVFITDAGHIYVADRDNGRVVELDSSGQLVRTIDEPRSDDWVPPEGFIYRPICVLVDRSDRIYVISDGCYDGIISFDPDGVFRGFFGAPRITISLTDYIWSRWLSTREQVERMTTSVPTEYSSFALDDRGFIYATVSGGALQATAAVRRLNPSGTDVLRRLGFHPPVGDVSTLAETLTGPSVFVDIVPLQNGIYSALDRRRGRVFSYDGTGNLLFTFGGRGDRDQIGTFRNPVALVALGDKLAVLDSGTNQITVFSPTAYARMIYRAAELYHLGQYEESRRFWNEVLVFNANYDLAYSSIGRALLYQGEHRDAMDYFRLGNDRLGYSDAFYRYRDQFVRDNFGLAVAGFLVIVTSLWLARRLGVATRICRALSGLTIARRMTKPSSSDGQGTAESSLRGPFDSAREVLRSLWYAGHLVFHPFDGFWELKYEKRGNRIAATIIVVGVCVTYILMRQYTGFVFNYRKLADLNILMEIASVAVPFGLWCLVNWALTTLMDGKGTIGDVFVASAYALTPMILINIPLTAISNVLVVEEGMFYYLFLAIAIIWSLGLLLVGTMVTHDYSLAKTLFTSACIVVGIGAVLFVVLLFANVVDLMGSLVRDMYSEIKLRL